MAGFSDCGTDWVPYIQGITLNAVGFIYVAATSNLLVHCTTKAAGDRTISLAPGYHPVKVTAIQSDTTAAAGALWVVTGPY
jgi:hypothetical protein